MGKDRIPVILLTLLWSTAVSGYCPAHKLQRIGAPTSCSFKAYCRGIIRNITLPLRCQGSPNVPVRIDLTLTDARDRVDSAYLSQELLMNVAIVRISAEWSKTSLFILKYLPNLEELYLRGNVIETIESNPFFYLNNLKNIDMSYNHLTSVPKFQFESSPNKLERLSLAFNLISVLPSGVFDELTSLIELDLSNNQLPDLTAEPFFNLTKLVTLKLNNNKIFDLNGAVNELRNLKHLFVSGNELENIDEESLDVIYHLETFDVSANKLESLTPTLFWRHWMHFFDEQPICRILLSENHITHLPNATIINLEISNRFTRELPNKHQIKALTELDLSKNQITDIEYNAFQTIVKLTYLDLSHNMIYDFIVNPEHLSDVRFLNLSSNYISNVYFRSFSSMRNLYNLDLSHNRMNDIPENTFLNNNNLKSVNFTDNDLGEITSIRIPIFHDDGGKLDLSNNGLTRLQVPIGEARRLTTLVLDSNNITDISYIELTDQDDLTTLIISNNNIGDLKKNSLRLPVTLTYLDLSNNDIDNIEPSTFLRVSHLKMLRLSHNQLSKIDYGIFHGLNELENLDLAYNRLSSLDSKVLRDLKSLRVLSLRYNDMNYLDDKSWFVHKSIIHVFLDGNNLSCDWLTRALINFDNGYSMMQPSVLQPSTGKNSLEGIPCINDAGAITDAKNTDTDERLLANSQKILEAIREQTFLLKNFWLVLRKQ